MSNLKTKAILDYDITENGKRIIAYTLNKIEGNTQEFAGRITITLESPHHYNGDKIKNLLSLINS
jgi:hypothetical protein